MENQSNLKWYQKTSGVIVLLILFFPVGLYLMWKNELWSKQTRWIVTGVFALMVIANASNSNSNNLENSSNSNSTENNQSEEISKQAYRVGYADGQLNYGEPNPPSYQYFLASHPEITGADQTVYQMGYNDGLQGNPQQY
jgi:hypothetical protein